MSRVWATGRDPFGLIPVTAAKVATSSAMSNQVSQVTAVFLAHTLPVALRLKESANLPHPWRSTVWMGLASASPLDPVF